MEFVYISISFKIVYLIIDKNLAGQILDTVNISIFLKIAYLASGACTGFQLDGARYVFLRGSYIISDLGATK